MGSRDGERKVSLINWADMCTPCDSGGSGIKDLKRQNNAFVMKLGFAVMTKPDLLWVKVIRSKYGWTRNGNTCIARNNSSSLWRNIASMWDTIISGCNWALGDGSNVNFWTDNWLGDLGPLNFFALIPLSDINLSLKVNNFVINGGWNWDYLSGVLPNSVLLHLAAVKPPTTEDGSDQIFWNRTSSGNITVRTAYDLQNLEERMGIDKIWNAVWTWPGAQRVKTMLWLCARDKLLTNHVRKRRHMTDDASCAICGSFDEDRDHVFRYCIFAREVWRKVLDDNVSPSFFNMPFTEWFSYNLQGSTMVNSETWTVTFGVTCWNLWTHRNDFIFKNERRSSEEIMHSIRSMVYYTVQAKRFLQLSQPGILPKTAVFIGWNPPPPSWIKLNTDGAVHAPMNNAAAGGIARDSNGRWAFGYSRYIGRCNVLQAELWGAVDGLNIAWNEGYRKVILEMDSKVAVDSLASKDNGINGNSSLFNTVRNLLARNWIVLIRHTYREGNRCADWMANYGFTHSIGLMTYSETFSGISQIISEDIIGVSIPRMCRPS